MSCISRSSEYTEISTSHSEAKEAYVITKRLCLRGKEVWGYNNVWFRIIKGWQLASFLQLRPGNLDKVRNSS